jgi:polysaccharide biosynthesis protein PslF
LVCPEFGVAIDPEGSRPMVKFGFLSSYPPSRCGQASFAAALRAALPPGTAGAVVRLGTPPDGPEPTEVTGSAANCQQAALVLNQEDIAVVQFEPDDSDAVVRVLGMLTVPTVVVLHAVPTSPTPVFNEILGASTAVVVMSEAARTRLADHGVPADRTTVIPHGASSSGGTKATPHRNQQRQILTWGLLGPGKGIEWAIDAMALLHDLRPEPRYVIAGQTHPNICDGDRYRDSLLSRVQDLGVTEQIRFDPRYLQPPSLRRLIAHAEVIVLPYDSTDQLTSGVLTEAVASRTPVVATRFPHAVELLANGCGILVNHRDPDSIADALRRILTDRTAAAGMAAAAGVAARHLDWPSVAERYRDLATSLLHTAAPLAATTG